jgi:L-asparaginase II
MTEPGLPNPVLAEVVRSGFAESTHRGRLVVLDANGEIAVAAGAVSEPMFPRSSNKPMQAIAMLSAGLGLGGRLLALAAASHSGQDFHVAGVREILAGAGLAEQDLQCPPDLPLHEASRAALLRAGGGPDRIHMNCSGKHAAMLATCVAAGWPTGSYRDPAHPLQTLIAAQIELLAGEPVAAVGVDGCGAPVFAISLAGLARAFRSAVLAGEGTAERQVADAMRAFPEWMSGTGRADATLMRAVPGLLAKSGAEGVLAFALADGRAGALKIDDGAQRPVAPVIASVLREIAGSGADLGELGRLASAAVTGGGEPVGQVRPMRPGGL